MSRPRQAFYRLFHTLNIDYRYEYVSRWVLSGLIVLSIVSLILETEPALGHYRDVFHTIEIVTVSLFCVEYVLRLWCIVERPRYAHPVWGRLQYSVTFFALVDLLSILPLILPFVSAGFLSVRALRLLRLISILKLGHYSQSMALIITVFRKKRTEIITSMFVVLILLVISSSLVYYLEHLVQPVAFGSIPRALWWGVSALTTVGYGDVYPITAMGKLCAAFISLLGISIVALPSGILVSGFVEELDAKKHKHLCERCKVELANELHHPELHGVSGGKVTI